MKKKPKGCEGCPLFGNGYGFVQDKNNGSDVTIMLSSPSALDVKYGVAGHGSPWNTLHDNYLSVVPRDKYNYAHAVRCLPQKTKRGGEVYCHPFGEGEANFYKSKVGQQVLYHCSQYDKFEGYKVAMGDGPFQLFKIDEDSLQNWRGFQSPHMPHVFYMYDPHFIDKAPQHKLAFRNDFRRFASMLEGKWPDEIPEMVMWGDHTENMYDDAPFVVIDTEYQYDPDADNSWGNATRLDLIGMWAPGCPVLQAGCVHGVGEFILRLVLEKKKTFVFQNTNADTLVLEKFLNIPHDIWTNSHDTMYAMACLWPELPKNLEYMASLYGRMPKLKHLAQSKPLLYNAGDVMETGNAWIGLSKELANDPRSNNIYNNYMLPLRPIIMKAERKGIRIWKEKVEEAREYLQGKVDFANELGQLVAGWDINLNSPSQVPMFLNEMGVKTRTLKADKLAALRDKFVVRDTDREKDPTPEYIMERIEDGAHPLLEARALFIQANQLLSSYITPLYDNGHKLRERVYPHFLPTAQDNGRWSTTEPPLAQLPESLRYLLIPDKGEAWIGFDWEQIELRIFANMSGDEGLLEIFEKGYDDHTMTCCEIFGYEYPPNLVDVHNSPENKEWRAKYNWEGKDDKRRVFAKTFKYRALYGGDPRGAGSLPGANKLGVPGEELVAGAYRWIAAHPALDNFWKKLAEDALVKGETRTFLGRRRRYNATDLKRRVRQAYDHPGQAGTTDIYNHTIIQVCNRLEDVRFVYGCHDSITFSTPIEQLGETCKVVREIAEREWDVNGRKMVVPIDGYVKFAPEERGLYSERMEDYL